MSFTDTWHGAPGTETPQRGQFPGHYGDIILCVALREHRATRPSSTSPNSDFGATASLSQAEDAAPKPTNTQSPQRLLALRQQHEKSESVTRDERAPTLRGGSVAPLSAPTTESLTQCHHPRQRRGETAEPVACRKPPLSVGGRQPPSGVHPIRRRPRQKRVSPKRRGERQQRGERRKEVGPGRTRDTSCLRLGRSPEGRLRHSSE